MYTCDNKIIIVLHKCRDIIHVCVYVCVCIAYLSGTSSGLSVGISGSGLRREGGK